MAVQSAENQRILVRGLKRGVGVHAAVNGEAENQRTLVRGLKQVIVFRHIDVFVHGNRRKPTNPRQGTETLLVGAGGDLRLGGQKTNESSSGD